MGIIRRVIVGSGYFDHEQLGTVHYVVRANARQFVARWKNQQLQLTIPPGTDMTQLREALQAMLPRLLSRKPDRHYHIGMVVDAGDFSVELRRSESARRTVTALRTTFGWALNIPADIDPASESAATGIRTLLSRIAYIEAPAILLPRAEALAREVGQRPSRWEISHGKSVLGRCGANRRIALSCHLVYLPCQLRDYVIYHELAHLSEMNHSPRFHAICDSYCHGKEKQLRALLKSTKLPV